MVGIDDKICSAVEFIERLSKFTYGEPGSFEQRMVTTNGCFDILTAGHVKCLEQAAGHGSFLVVLLNSDASVARYKGAGRPFVPYVQRAIVLAGLASVRNVVPFDEDTPYEILERFYESGMGPQVHVKGGDYVVPERLLDTPGVTAADYDKNYAGFPEAEVVHRYGGEVVTIPFEIDISTSQIVQRICEVVTGNTYVYKKREALDG